MRSNQKLWEQIKNKVKNSDKAGEAGTWNARKAQLAVKEYKKMGGEYHGEKSNTNSLVKWTKENWGYIDDKPGGRYLPAKVRKSLTPIEKKRENRLKRRATSVGKQRAKYSQSVANKMRKLNVF